MASHQSTTGPPVLVLHGPNLDLLGTREPEIYGELTLAALDDQLRSHGEALGLQVDTEQRNGEGDLIDLVHDAARRYRGLIINPGGYTHTSVAIADALRAVKVPTIEVHLSNLFAREPFRHVSHTAAACEGAILGFGGRAYHLALVHLAHRLGCQPDPWAADPTTDRPPQ